MIHVIIPVYKGLEETKRCINSVLNANNNIEHSITIIDDCSPDTDLSTYLIALAKSGLIQLLKNEHNLGFVATVNRGMALNPDKDVILLNSDTEVAGDWLDRLHRCAYSSPNIGTVTPFSNNATICSYPKFCEDNALPKGWDVAKLDAIFRQTNTGKCVEIPTAVGFCMYIKRLCLNEVGLFDVKAFGKGYGEENDFCMRAHKRGWKHVLCTDTFVYHTGGISFAETQNIRKEQAMMVLQKRHPLYKILVAKHLKKDPAKPYRLIIDLMRIIENRLPTILFITHRRGGGTERHLQELYRNFEQNSEALVLRPYLWNVVSLEWMRHSEQFRLYFNIEQDYTALLTLLRLIGLSQIHFHHLFGHNQKILEIPSDININFDFTIHDYYSICPRISLTGTDYRYCSEPDTEQCNICLQKSPVINAITIQQWRDKNRRVLNKAMHVFVPSEDGARRIQSYYSDANVVLAPHLDIIESKCPEPRVLPVTKNEKLRIVVIGAMSKIKGADVLEQCAILANQFNLPLQFHLIGYAYKDIAELSGVFTVHGEYKDVDLPKLISDSCPHVIWFPAQWPETYSYTLSAALMSGLPIVAPDIGAFTERLHQRPWSWVCPWDWTPDDWNNFFIQVKENNFATGVSPNPINSPQNLSYYRYQDYLPQTSRFIALAGNDLAKVRHLLIDHDRAHFNILERLVLNSRKVLNPIFHVTRFSTLITKIPGRVLSPYNRKMIKAWLSGQWPS